jgi:taurine dioxygenase
MRAKGYDEERIDALSNLYPPTRHPLVQKSRFGHSLYFNELCVSGFENVDCAYSEKVIDDLLKNMRASVDTFKQIWEPGDTVIWDNFSCIHRASSDQGDGLRILHRTTAI